MREIIRPGGGYTLEDIIKRGGAQKPTVEMQKGIVEARKIMQSHQLVQALGLSGLDPVLLHAFIAERVIRTRLYDLEWVSHSPEFLSSPKIVARDDLMISNLEESLNRLALERNGIVTESYGNTKDRLRARNLELAANDLVARGSVFIENERNPHTDIIISDELLDSWALRWRDKFVPKRRPLRQKHLLYKK